jgi:hypothetical protein
MAFRNIASHTFLIVSGGVKPSQVDVSPQGLRTRPRRGKLYNYRSFAGLSNRKSKGKLNFIGALDKVV